MNTNTERKRTGQNKIKQVLGAVYESNQFTFIMRTLLVNL